MALVGLVDLAELQHGTILPRYVTDIEAARRFYVEVLGLEVERYHPVFVQFNNFAIASDASLSGNRDPEVYWLVDDAEAAFNDPSQKAEVSLTLKQMPFGKVFAIKDPTQREEQLRIVHGWQAECDPLDNLLRA